jgi:hypothetical protein
MVTSSEPAAPSQLRFREIATIICLVLSACGWLSQLNTLQLIANEWVASPKVGDEGIGLLLYAPAVMVVSFVLLIASIASSLSADRLPRWLRALAVVLPAAGCLTGAAILYRVMS